MNSENYLFEEKENWLGVKFQREKNMFERFKSIRENFVSESRKKIENRNLQNNPQFIQTVQRQKELVIELANTQKLKASQNKDVKQFLIFIRNLSKNDPKFFANVIENGTFVQLHQTVLEHMYCSAELKHEALWNVSIASNFSLSYASSEALTIAVASLVNKLLEFQNMDQVIFMEKMLYSLTNFLFDHSSLAMVLEKQLTLQRLAVNLLHEVNSDNISLSLWFIRNLLKSSRYAFEDCLKDFSLQNAIFTILKNYSQDFGLLFETLWTIVHISEREFNYQVMPPEILLILLEIALNNEDFILLPTLTVLGNIIPTLDDETIGNMVNSDLFYKLLQNTLSANNSLVKREGLFLISNLVAQSKVSAEFVLQKKELIDFLMEILTKQEPVLLKEALFIIYNICFSFDKYFYPYIKPTLEQSLQSLEQLFNKKFFDQEVTSIQGKLYSLLISDSSTNGQTAWN